jgi:hypothetical protein
MATRLSKYGHAVVEKLHYVSGVNEDQATTDDDPPPFIPSQDGHAEVAKLLCSRGANNDPATKDDTTPLFIASQIAHAEVAKLLCVCGATKFSPRGMATHPYGRLIVLPERRVMDICWEKRLILLLERRVIDICWHNRLNALLFYLSVELWTFVERIYRCQGMDICW